MARRRGKVDTSIILKRELIMNGLFIKLNAMTIEDLEHLLNSTDDFSYECDRKVFLALVIKVIKQKKLDFIKSRVL